MEVQPFSLHNYITLKSCLDTQEPSEINIFINGPEPENNYWNKIKTHVNVIKYNFITEVDGKKIPKPSHVADIARAEIVYKYGGIYCDIDTLFLNKIPDEIFNTNKCLFEIEPLSTTSKEQLMSSVLMAPKNHPFLEYYLNNKRYIHKYHAYYSGALPTHLWKRGRSDLDGVRFNKLGFNTWDVPGRQKFYASHPTVTNGSYLIPMCQNANYESYLKHITEQHLFEYNSTFTVNARRFLEKPNMLSKLTAIMPVKIDSTDRLENILVVSDYITKRLHVPKLIIIEIDKEPRLFNFFKDNDQISYSFVEDHGVWSRGRAFNTVLPWVKTDVVAIWDTDAVIPSQSLHMAYKNIAEEDADIAMPYSIFYHVHRKFIRDAKYGALNFNIVNDPRNYDHAFDQVIGGGICLYRTSLLRHIRGFSELFNGWGAEDDEVVARAQKLGAKVIRVNGPLVHFFHERTPTCVPHEHYKKYNIAERARMISWDADQIAEYMGITKKIGKYSTLREPEEPTGEIAELVKQQPLD